MSSLNRDAQDGEKVVETGNVPHADEIVIPEDMDVEPLEPVDLGEAHRRRRLRLPRGAIGRWFGRIGTRLRMVFDGLLLVIAFPAPLLILGWQSFTWLRTGHWVPMPVERLTGWFQIDMQALAQTSWPGLSRLLDWVLAAPLAGVLFAAGLGLHLLAGLLFPRLGRAWSLRP